MQIIKVASCTSLNRKLPPEYKFVKKISKFIKFGGKGPRDDQNLSKIEVLWSSKKTIGNGVFEVADRYWLSHFSQIRRVSEPYNSNFRLKSDSNLQMFEFLNSSYQSGFMHIAGSDSSSKIRIREETLQIHQLWGMRCNASQNLSKIKNLKDRGAFTNFWIIKN